MVNSFLLHNSYIFEIFPEERNGVVELNILNKHLYHILKAEGEDKPMITILFLTI